MAGKVIGGEAAAKMAGDFVENSTIALIDNYQKEKTTNISLLPWKPRLLVLVKL
jgi:hypothetical protein